MFRKNVIKILLICISVLIVYGFMQSFQPKNIVLKATPSYFIENNLFIPIASISMFLTYVIISYMFLRIRNGLKYNAIVSGILFSLSFIGFWFVGMFEPYLLFNESFYFCLFLAIVDSIALLLLGLLLGIFIKKTIIHTTEKIEMTNMSKIVLVALFFLLGRLFSYIIIGVHSSLKILPFENILWVISIGLATGFLYWISYNANRYSPIKKAMWFGLSYFGIIWIIYNSFNPLFVKHEIFGIGNISLMDLYIKTFVDVIFVTFGIVVIENIYCRKQSISKIREA